MRFLPLMIKQKRRAVDQRPGQILVRCQTPVGELLGALVDARLDHEPLVGRFMLTP